MSKPAHKNTETPPGQIRFCEACYKWGTAFNCLACKTAAEAIKAPEATTPSTGVWGRYGGLVGALVDLCEQAEGFSQGTDVKPFLLTTEVRALIEKYTK